MILPNATSFDTLGPRKAFTFITKDGVSLDMTMPERIYNSHYGNGVPAMFTS